MIFAMALELYHTIKTFLRPLQISYSQNSPKAIENIIHSEQFKVHRKYHTVRTVDGLRTLLTMICAMALELLELYDIYDGLRIVFTV
jgi:hypothetical protein